MDMFNSVEDGVVSSPEPSTDILKKLGAWPLAESGRPNPPAPKNWKWRYNNSEWVLTNELVIFTVVDWMRVNGIEDAQPAPHIFDVINYWPQPYRRCLGTKDLPEGWMWQWIGDDWVLSNGTIGLVRADWFKYRNKMAAGTKADSGKPMMGCIPPHAELAVARVLTFGAQKYSRGNWAHVENSDERYMDAALRHINAHRLGEQVDSETCESHLAHAICCLMFMLDKSESK